MLGLAGQAEDGDDALRVVAGRAGAAVALERGPQLAGRLPAAVRQIRDDGRERAERRAAPRDGRAALHAEARTGGYGCPACFAVHGDGGLPSHGGGIVSPLRGIPGV